MGAKGDEDDSGAVERREGSEEGVVELGSEASEVEAEVGDLEASLLMRQVNE